MILRHTMFGFDASEPFDAFHTQCKRMLQFQNTLDCFSVSLPQWYHILAHRDVRQFVEFDFSKPRSLTDPLGKIFGKRVREVCDSLSWPSHLCMVSYFPPDPRALANAIAILQRQIDDQDS